MDYKDLKSLLSSLGFILFYIYATIGVVKLFWDTKDDYRFEGRVKFLLLFQILFAFVYLISIYHIAGPRNTNTYYMGYLITQIGYVVIGLIANMFLKRK